jgi:hypothetical protein
MLHRLMGRAIFQARFTRQESELSTKLNTLALFLVPLLRKSIRTCVTPYTRWRKRALRSVPGPKYTTAGTGRKVRVTPIPYVD